MLMNSGMAGYPEEYFEYLKETGLPRQPIEYFELRNEFLAGTVQEAKKRRSDHQRLKEWSSHGYASLAKVVLNARCTANGVFGAKMMWGYFGDFLSQMFATDVGDPNLSNERIQAFFPNLRYIWMRRKDSLLQAISLWKAIQTQCWRMDAGDERDRKACNVSFSYEAISYGATGGPWTEGYDGCANADYFKAGLETAHQINAIVDYATKLPNVKPTDVIVVGQSAGGWGTIAYSSLPHPSVSAFINMAGGRGGHYQHKPNNNCQSQNLVTASGQYGKTSRVPMLWIYARNDTFFAPSIADAMYKSFIDAGGKAQLIHPDKYGHDGHHLFLGAGGSEIWGPLVENYLSQVKATSQ